MTIDEFLQQIEHRQPPAPAVPLAELEAELGCALPADYRDFLVRCNGGFVGGELWFFGPTPEGHSVQAGVHHVGGFREESHFSIPETRAVYGGRIPAPLLWIMDDPFGNAICIAVGGERHGAVFFWDHEDEPDPDTWDGRMESAGNIGLLANSFTEFVAGLSSHVDRGTEQVREGVGSQPLQRDRPEHTVVRIRGWRQGLQTASMIQTIRGLADVSLAEAKVMSERVLDREVVDVAVRDAATARELAAELQRLGADAEVVAQPARTAATKTQPSILQRLLQLFRRKPSTPRPRRVVERSPRDHSPKVPLAAGPGELWVGFRLGRDDEEDEKVLEALVEHVESSGLAEWTGQSVGTGQRDVTFEAIDRRRVARRIATWFAQHVPARDFWISTEYETTFDQR